ncbi:MULTISPECIES: glycoside hydrolase family 32 protein [Eubacteriales]|uniref:glycoside hydrolase family 32 protein n=1 Tax=Eubacteriales TaxID=186802 RepID=UPI001105B545|nr:MULTISPECIES: glycoside hydrolase family 32 protein [Eubacteriales]
MNALTRDLKQLVELAEKAAPAGGHFRQKIHLIPPTGWLNDPNGLCQFKGLFHAFFQYSPFNPEGGVKMWGHCTSRDMVHWEYQGTALYPDQPFDCHGAYSGCALVEDGRMYLYYTGNVKLEDREYDYVLAGREGNTVLVESEDGFSMGRKQLLMRNEDYPADLSCHVRDPKVWKQDGRYYMIQGVRTKEDVGEAQIFVSGDRLSWSPLKRIRTEEPFGYMWECPDYMDVDGQKLLSASVQGLEGDKWRDQNVYQSGYFYIEGDILGEYSLSEYQLWDCGFDFYAPQSFVTEDGRVVAMAWMGMPDCPEYGNEPALAEGWQHCFTFPREIFIRDGAVRQRPVRELEKLKRKVKEAQDRLEAECPSAWEADITGIQGGAFRAVLGGGLALTYTGSRFEMRFEGPEGERISGGRRLRYQEMKSLDSVKILGDASSVEVFVNGGEYVFTTRYYPETRTLEAEADGAEISLYSVEL